MFARLELVALAVVIMRRDDAHQNNKGGCRVSKPNTVDVSKPCIPILKLPK